MAALITQLRSMTDAGTADYTVNGSSYWTDDQLQQMLDQTRVDVRRKLMRAEALYDNGTVHYYDYYLDMRYVEGTASGSAAFRVENSVGSTIAGTLYTPALDVGHLLFSYDTLGSAYYFSGRQYDLNRAAAMVWEQKAADVANRFDLEIDNHNMKRSQLYDHYLHMAASFRSSAKPMMIRMKRVDVN